MSVLLADTFTRYRRTTPMGSPNFDLDEAYVSRNASYVSSDGYLNGGTTTSQNIASCMRRLLPAPTGVLRLALNVTNRNGRFFAAGPGDMGLALGPNAPIELSIFNGFLRVRYSVFQGEETQSGMASVVMEAGAQLVGFNEPVFLELEIDHRTNPARTRAYVNGALVIDHEYDRDVIAGASNFPTNLFGWVAVTPRSNEPRLLDYVVWNEDGEGLSHFPAGNLSVDYLTLDDPALQLPVNYFQRVTLDSTDWQEFQVQDAAPGPVHAAWLHAMVAGSDGTEPSRLGYRVSIGGQELSFEELVAPGFNPRQVYEPLPFSLLLTENINVATVSLRRQPDES